MSKIAEALALAIQYQQAGQWSQAEQLYRQIVAADPRHAEAWRRLGSVCSAVGNRVEASLSLQNAVAIHPGYAEAHNELGILRAQNGELDAAVAYFREASRLAPQFADPCNNLGVVLGMQGKYAEAEAAFQQALGIRPDNAEAYNNLGKLYLDRGQPAAAMGSYQQALRVKPDYAEALHGLALALQGQGRTHEAAASYQQALRLRPNYAEAYNNIGLVLTDMGRFDDAVAHLQQAARLRPNSAAVHTNLGNALRKLKKSGEAVASYHQALRCDANHADAYNGLGNACLELGQWNDAIANYQQAIARRPQLAEAHNNLGNAFVERRLHAQAEESYQQAIRLKPDYAEAHRNLALLWLLLGNFEKGWAEFEWRWRCRDFPQRSFPQPRWDGSSLAGQTILLHAEQGFGDTLQFVRYAALVKERGGTVVVECQPALVALVASCPGIDQVVAAGSPLPYFSVHAPLLSLPGILRTSVESIPAKVPYLRADPALVERWRSEASNIAGFKIGIVWQGRPSHPGDRYRSVSVIDFTALARHEGVRIISLQVGSATAQAAGAGDLGVIDWGNRFDPASFGDAAAAIMNLDLVVTVDTAVAHLAGALGAPVWVAVPYAPDFRWLLEREDSPWYPTMRLFRQKEPGDWGAVFTRMGAELPNQLRERRG
jgi:tetratricopeptide (TPR) repeat protein